MGAKRTRSESSPQSDEYAQLKDELAQLAERGRDDKDESAPGREIALASFYLQSRYGTIVTTDANGLPQGTFTVTRPDRKGVERTQRFFLGLGCEVLTKDVAQQAENVGARKRVVSEFEVTKNAPQLFSATVEKAQDAGDKLQRKIDEENYEHWGALVERRKAAAATFGARCEPIGVPEFGRLMALAEQVIEAKLGARLDKCEMLAAHFAEAQVYASADGCTVDSVLPRVALVVQAKTKSGLTTFGAIRGAGGGIECLTRGGEESAQEAVRALAERVAQDAADRERAQGSAVLGSECPVILSSHAAGVLAHEVFGHTSEGDIICENRRSKTAKLILKQRLGAQVSSHRALTIVDSGQPSVDFGGKVVPYMWGQIPHDERGQPAQYTTLVSGGVMINFLSDERSMGEVLDGLKPEVAEAIREHGLSGNVRREKYDLPAQVRMTNTFILADPQGPKSLTEMAALVPKNKRGVYIKTCAGGWVQTESGDFALKGALGFVIENGVVTDKPVKDIDITGNVGKFGDSIKAIGSVETIDGTFTGYCGKNDQWVPVEGGGPLLYVENAKLGSSGGWSFEQALGEYLQQLGERRSGQRERVYVPSLAEASGIEDQEHLCLVCQALPLGQEADLLLGRAERADFARGGDGKLVAARGL